MCAHIHICADVKKRGGIVLVSVSIAVIKHHNHKHLGEGGFILLPRHNPPSEEIRTGTQDRNLEAGADVEAREECCSLTCSLGLASPVFSQHPGPPGPEMAPYTEI